MNWLARALSNKGEPSSSRLVALMAFVVMTFWGTWMVMVTTNMTEAMFIGFGTTFVLGYVGGKFADKNKETE